MQTNTNYNFDYQEYLKRTRKKQPHTIFILMTVIIGLMIVAFFVKPNNNKLDNLYLVRINTYLTYSEASKMSNEIQSRGGAGYIFFDGKYHVIASYYTTESEAISVVDNLATEYPTANVYTLEISQYKNKKTLSNNQNKAITNLIQTANNMIKQVYSLLLQYDKNEITSNELTIRFTDIITLLEDKIADYKAELSSNNANYINSIEKLDDITSSLNTIKSNLDKSYQLKYELVSIVFSYSSLLACF